MDCIVHGVKKSQTRMSDFHFHFHILCILITLLVSCVIYIYVYIYIYVFLLSVIILNEKFNCSILFCEMYICVMA